MKRWDQVLAIEGATSSHGKNADIEALRAFAIGLTIAAHLDILLPGLQSKLSFFWLGGGVDLFFCISGFVITLSVQRALAGRQGPDFLGVALPFWARRVFRLWPAALFWAAIDLTAVCFFNKSGVFGPLRTNLNAVIAAVAQVENFHLAACLKTKPVPCAPSVFGPYWSLSLEEQFYILFPFLLLLPRRAFKVVLMLAIAAQFFLKRDWPSLGWFGRTDAICFGILLALGVQTRAYAAIDLGWLDRYRLRLPVLFGALALLFLVARPEVVSFYHGLVALISAALVLLASFDLGYVVRGTRMRRVMLWLGERSYSLYLTNALGFGLVRELCVRTLGDIPHSAVGGAAAVFAALLLMLVLSDLSVRLIERPTRAIGRTVSRQIWRSVNPGALAPQIS